MVIYVAPCCSSAVIRLVVIESVMTLSLVRDTETNEADEIDRSIEQSVVALCSE